MIRLPASSNTRIFHINGLPSSNESISFNNCFWTARRFGSCRAVGDAADGDVKVLTLMLVWFGRGANSAEDAQGAILSTIWIHSNEAPQWHLPKLANVPGSGTN